MKKIIKIIVPLILMLVCVTGAFAQGTLSEEILNQAKREAGLFLELKSALGLDWLDEYNAYLENPTDNPEPSWDLSVADLVSGGYLSDSFPSDFTITKSGQEVKISRIITSQAMKDVLPIYLPSVTIAGDVVSLIVQRPEQWVAWQAGLLGKVSRDGSDNPDILPNAVLDFGKGSEIRFINDDGKLTGIENLIYRDDELDDRFVNTSGDDEMSGTLTAGGFKVGNYIVWHEGNDGHREDGSGLDADLLDGEHGSYYLDAKNLTGIVPLEKLDGTYNIDISGKASTATYASDSDKLDGYDSSHFATVGHTHSYVSIGGDTMIGTLNLPNLEVQSGGSVKFYSESGASTISTDQSGNLNLQANKVTVPSKMDVGGLKITDIYAQDVFGWKSSVDLSGSNVGIRVPDQNILLGFNDKGGITVVDTTNGAPLFELDRKGQLYVNRNKVWHAGNDGSGSGLDADFLDGLDSSEFARYLPIPGGADLNDYKKSGFYYSGNLNNSRTIKNTPYRSNFSLIVIPSYTCLQIYIPQNAHYIYFRNYTFNDDKWHEWRFIQTNGPIDPINPDRLYFSLSDDPIDITQDFLSVAETELIKSDEVTDNTGTYSMWKYKISYFDNSGMYFKILNRYKDIIKSRTNLSTVNAIHLCVSSYPKTEGNILAAAAFYLEVLPQYNPELFGKYGVDFYNSIQNAKDIVGKTQAGTFVTWDADYLQSIELYTMKSRYQYNNIFIEVQSDCKISIIGAWGQ